MYVRTDERERFPETQFQAYNDGSAIKIELNVAGYAIDDVKVETTKEVIKVYGSKNESKKWGEGFFNEFPIKDNKILDPTGQEASVKLDLGILTISVPVAAEFVPKTLEIK